METESFVKPWRYVIIAMKGLPCTWKSLVAQQIGDWAERPVLYIDDFIGAPINNSTADGWEEAERLQASLLEQAFSTLCRVADRHVRAEIRCVVIKSRLSSPFELQQLSQALLDISGNGRTLLIVECRLRNKHKWQKRFNNIDDDRYEKKWNRPQKWNDIEKAIEDHSHPQALSNWDLHLQHLIQLHNEVELGDPISVRRLVVDPHDDLGLPATQLSINPIFAHAINHLLNEEFNQKPYVVEFDEFRRSRAEEILNALTSSPRSKHLCEYYGCLFKYRERLRVDGDDNEGIYYCRVCDQKVVSGQPGYTCHYCVFTLHKSCAELTHFDPHTITWEYIYSCNYINDLPTAEKYNCNSHLQGFNEYCASCIFQTSLKCRKLPAVVSHCDPHPHPLSRRIDYKLFICKACGVDGHGQSYVCNICEWYYHIQCPFMPGEWKNGHGGHEHVLELKYSHEDKAQEDYWCDVCFEDLDLYYWYYSCPSCPYYAAHLYCVGFYPCHFWDI